MMPDNRDAVVRALDYLTLPEAEKARLEERAYNISAGNVTQAEALQTMARQRHTELLARSDALDKLQQTWAENKPAAEYKKQRDTLTAALRGITAGLKVIHETLEKLEG
jgi:hypothetical protein